MISSLPATARSGSRIVKCHENVMEKRSWHFPENFFCEKFPSAYTNLKFFLKILHRLPPEVVQPEQALTLDNWQHITPRGPLENFPFEKFSLTGVGIESEAYKTPRWLTPLAARPRRPPMLVETILYTTRKIYGYTWKRWVATQPCLSYMRVSTGCLTDVSGGFLSLKIEKSRPKPIGRNVEWV